MPSPVVMAILQGGVLASALFWIALIRRRRQGIPFVELRRPVRVPWNGWHVLMLVLMYIALNAVAAQAMLIGVGQDSAQASTAKTSVDSNKNAKPTTAEEEERKLTHPVALLVLEQPGLLGLFLAFASAGLGAPLGEEFFFRVSLQGWLEALHRRLRFMRPLARYTRAAIPIALSATAFALPHLRLSSEPPDVDLLMRGMVVSLASNIVATLLGVMLLRSMTGATWSDLGLLPREVLGDVKLGLGTFLAMLAPTFLIHIPVQMIGQKLGLALDPIALLVLASILGYVYFRTHRWLPLIVAHAAFNCFTLTMVLIEGMRR